MNNHLTPIIRSHQIAALDSAFNKLTEAETFNDVQNIRDMGEAARILAKKAQLGLEVQNKAAELKLRAERKAGEFLASLKLAGGDRKSKQYRTVLKLEDLGITSDQSRYWQKEASVPEDVFEAYIEQAQKDEREISSAALLRLAKKSRSSKTSSSQNRTNGIVKNVNNLNEVVNFAEPQQISKKLTQLETEFEELKGHYNSASSLIGRDKSNAQSNISDEKKKNLLRHYLTELEKSFQRIDSIFSSFNHDRKL